MWEISYGFFAWVGMGMTLSSQFVALSASKPEKNAATSVTTYYLVQQVGFMMGITLSKALISRDLESRLMVALRNEAGKNEVSIHAILQIVLFIHAYILIVDQTNHGPSPVNEFGPLGTERDCTAGIPTELLHTPR
jgi:hypothetical protein